MLFDLSISFRKRQSIGLLSFHLDQTYYSHEQSHDCGAEVTHAPCRTSTIKAMHRQCPLQSKLNHHLLNVYTNRPVTVLPSCAPHDSIKSMPSNLIKETLNRAVKNGLETCELHRKFILFIFRYYRSMLFMWRNK